MPLLASNDPTDGTLRDHALPVRDLTYRDGRILVTMNAEVVVLGDRVRAGNRLETPVTISLLPTRRMPVSCTGARWAAAPKHSNGSVERTEANGDDL